MKALSSYVLGIFLAGAFSMGSMGCIAQAGTEESSQAEGLTANQGQPAQVVQQQNAATMKQRVLAPGTTVAQPVMQTTDIPEVELEGLAGTDPGGNVQDDGDGKEPDPHPWHSSRSTLASH